MKPAKPIAENHIRISRTLFNEGMRAAGSKEYQKSVQKIAAVLAVLFAAAAAWLLYTGGSLIFLLGEAIFLGALLFWLIVMLPGTRRRSKYKAMMQGSEDAPERTVRFYQEHLTVTSNSGKETTISYHDVINWQETTHLYILNCKDNISVLLDKSGFTAGDFDDVKRLLTQASHLDN